MENINKIIEDIKSSPLFYLFLSSKELFHTNFWYWLSEVNKDETLKLFTNQETKKPFFFKREKRLDFNKIKSIVDLYITDNNSLEVIIENKIKDFPTETQLNRIRESANGHNREFLLVTLLKPDTLKFEGWEIISYGELSTLIKPEKFTDCIYHLLLIKDYKNFISNLDLLGKELVINDIYDFAYYDKNELFAQLDQIKLWELYQKLRASHLVESFKKLGKQNIKTSYSLNNKKATIDFYIEIKGKYKIGIQIEGNQYRKYINMPNAEEKVKKLIKEDLFFKNKFRGRANKLFLNFGSSFKYQNEKINQLDFIVLFKKINDDIDYIEQNIIAIEWEILN